MAELFEDIEVNKDPRWPLLLKLVGGSFVLHALVAAGVLYVPAIRDTLNVVSAFSGIRYTDEDYDRTIIGQRAEMLAFKDGKFQYPPGYFNVVLEGPVAAVKPLPTPTPPEAKIISEFKSEPEEKADTRKKPEKAKPSPTPSPAVSPSPFEPPVPGDIAADAKLSDQERNKKLDEIAAKTGVERPPAINAKPFKDALARAKKLKDDGELDLNGSIEMTITADRQPDGSLTNVKPTIVKGDPKLTEVALDFVAALSDSHALVFLKGTEHLKMTVKVNDSDINVTALSDAESADRAKEMASGFNGLIFLAGLADRPEAVIYKSTKISATGKEVVVNFSMSRAAASAMLSKQLAAS